MRIPEIAIKNSRFIYVIMAILLFVGMKSYKSMPKSEDPFMDLPIYTVVVIYPGAAPEDVEGFVVDPIENVLDDIDDITEIRTEITNGLSVMKIQAEYGIDYDEKYDEILAAVNNIRSDLPSDIYDLQITQYKPEDRVVVHQYAIASEVASYAQLYDVAEKLQDKIEKIELVKQTQIDAYPSEEIHIQLDLYKLSELGLNLRQVISLMKENNANIPAGDINVGLLNFNINSSESYRSIEDIEKIRIRSVNNQITYLHNVATVKKGYEDQKWVARTNGKRCIYLSVNQKRNSNILTLSNQLATVTNEIKNELPDDIEILTAFEQAPAVKGRINDFVSNLLQGIILVGLIIWVFLGWRSGIVVMMVIPLSIIIAITLLDFTGYALQQISIAALVIALGLLVDNGIVVIENIIRFQKEGYSLAEAAAKGTAEVSYAIISSTITTVLAFAPLALLESGPGEYLRSLPLTVIYALAASLVLALIFTPIIAKVFLPNAEQSNTWVSGKVDIFIEKVYRPVIAFSLKRGWIVLSVGALLLVGAGSLFPKIGISFFPTADKSMLLITVDLPYSASINRTDRAVRYVESILDTADYVRSYSVNVGHGNPQVYYNRVPEEYKIYHGEILVNFHQWNPKQFYSTLDQFEKAFDNYPDARISFRELKNGSPFEAPVEIIIQGENMDSLKRISFEVEKVITQTQGTYDIDNPMAFAKTDINVNINRDKAALYHLSLLEIDQALKVGVSGLPIEKVTLEDENETYPLVVQMANLSHTNLDDLQRIYLTNHNGYKVPLRQISNIEFKAEHAKISHFNQTRSIGITANVVNPDNTKTITESIINELEKLNWPKGYTYHIGGEYETQQQSFGDLGTFLILALLGIFAVLVLQFRSLIQPLIIFSAIPLAITGSFFTLFITGWSFSFFAFVGFISLVGIVVNNSIILVDYTNQLIREGMDKLSAIQFASERRFTPILLTTLTTILGLIPLTLSGTNLWSPLGWTLIGGLTSSMLLTLIVVPVLYNLFTPNYYRGNQ